VLDCGCGNGLSVELLADRGFQAFGIDTWVVREQQWLERKAGAYVVADGTRLPFVDAQFDIVLSSGVLEHIGVHEEWQPRYKVAPLPDQAVHRTRFISECLRVLRTGGVIYIDHPNGAFPIDFWHGDGRGLPRFHRLSEGFLPTYAEVRRLTGSVAPNCRVEAISAARRFVFRRVGRRWYGKLAAAPVELAYRLMEHRPFRWLARTALNPYLVLRISRV
jgi:SAM-dependent methyltransferase